MKKIIGKSRRVFTVAGIIICLIIIFFPTYGPPHFRYTGSNPTIDVWNFGWPLASFIYDSNNGLHIGPTLHILIFIAIIIITIAACIFFLGSFLSQRHK